MSDLPNHHTAWIKLTDCMSLNSIKEININKGKQFKVVIHDGGLQVACNSISNLMTDLNVKTLVAIDSKITDIVFE